MKKFNNLSQVKKYLKVGMKYRIIENAIKPQNSNNIRVVEKVQTNSIKGSGVWLEWQKARNTRINEDNTIDFLLGEEMKDEWLIDQQKKENKDYWLKIEILD